MKNLFLLIAVVLFISCNNDDKESSINELKGSWKLVSTSGGIDASTSPIPGAQQIVLDFSDNSIKTYENLQVIRTQKFTFQTKKSIFGGIKKMIAIQTNSLANDIARVQSIEIIGDKLYLRDECFDCFTMEYVRINPAAFKIF